MYLTAGERLLNINDLILLNKYIQKISNDEVFPLKILGPACSCYAQGNANFYQYLHISLVCYIVVSPVCVAV